MLIYVGIAYEHPSIFNLYLSSRFKCHLVSLKFYVLITVECIEIDHTHHTAILSDLADLTNLEVDFPLSAFVGVNYLMKYPQSNKDQVP